jgi:AraC-like DNA-binding protein
MLTLAFPAGVNSLNAAEPTVLAVAQLLREVIIDLRLRDIAAILADDPAGGRTLAELGRAVGASQRTLSRLFRRDTGMTFPQWRAQLRLQHAMPLLATGSTVTGAATATGYAHTSAFIAAFRDAFSTTPAVYRNEM